MPIILDQDSTNTKKQMQKVSKQVNQYKNVRPKWFHEHLTGTGSRKTGFFNDENNTIAQITKNSINKLGKGSELTSALKNMMSSELINYYTNTKPSDSYFTPYSRTPTSAVMPALLSNYQPKGFGSSDRNTPWRIINDYGVNLEFTRKTPLFNIANIDKWFEISNENGVRTVIRPIVQSYLLASAKIKSASTSASGRNQFSSAGEPIIYLAVATLVDDVDDDATIQISKQKQKPSKEIIPMSLIPVDTDINSTYLMTQYVGPVWSDIIENIEDHYYRCGLNSFETRVHGILDVDSFKAGLVEEIGDLSIPEEMTTEANVTANQLEDIMSTTVSIFLNMVDNNNHSTFKEEIQDYAQRALKMSIQTMDYFGNKDENLITTDFLNDIYQALKRSTLSNDRSNNVVQESLRLLLSQRLHELEVVNKAGSLHKFDPQDDKITQQYMNDPGYSRQQRKIVTTTDPLVIGQAGAGSGKSHTLIGRIKYLRDQKEDLSKALVLSFTNVAAININQRFPEVRSETLANMFNQIYQNTYPAQSLSQPSTVANSLRLLNPNANMFKNKGFKTEDVESYIDKFSRTLADLDQSGFKRVNIQEVTKDLANMIQHNMKLTETLLDAVEQTTLELQPIIIHHHLMENNGRLNVPTEYQELQYIITDESQDISTFEYILLLELAIHHSAQLLIVGDGSQTLYEFRNSDPKYMNALEASGVFTTYKLDVNFRSSPEVLMFANQFLDVIEANDIAKIQLNASSFAKATEKSFQEAITVHNVEANTSKPIDYHEALAMVVDESDEFDKWMKDIVENDEQVAVLGWTRNEVLEFGEKIEEWLANNGYDIEVTNIMNNRSRPMTVISNILAKINQELLRLDPTKSDFKDKILKLVSHEIHVKYHYSSTAQKSFFTGEFERAIDSVIYNYQWSVLTKEVQNGKISRQAAIGHLTREMLRYETRKNAMDAHLMKNQEAPNYADEKIILSTIHGAKGLEFENTIVLFNESKRGATSQESLRMLFVALSRAEKKEYIINSHTPNRKSVSNTLSAMFDTPMESAYMRALDAINKP